MIHEVPIVYLRAASTAGHGRLLLKLPAVQGSVNSTRCIYAAFRRVYIVRISELPATWLFGLSFGTQRQILLFYLIHIKLFFYVIVISQKMPSHARKVIRQ